MTYELYTGNCLEILPTLEAGSVDAILTDLPYGTTACSWDTVIPFEPMWEQVKRVLRPRGVFVTTASQPFTSRLVMSNLEWFKYCLVWKKSMPFGFYHAKNQPLKGHEDICVFSNGVIAHLGKSDSRMTYNPQMLQGKPYRKYKRHNASDEHRLYRPSNIDHWIINDGQRYPTTVIEIGNGNNNSLHPTQKPVALYEYLIRTYTNEGDTVLDICMGSGTTGVACMNTGRRFIGIELDEGYAEIARKRIEHAASQARQLELI